VLFWITVSVICYLLLKQMTRTITLLLAGIGRIAAGDLDSRIRITDNSDTGQAAAEINSLAEKLQLKEAENQRLLREQTDCLRLELDEEKTRHMAKLIQTNRMTSLGLLVSSMAHEINNPNGTSKLAGEFLAKVWRDAEPLLAEMAENEGDFSLGGMHFSQCREEITKAIDNISRSSIRIERVVQNLRSYSLGDRDEVRRDVDLNRVANSALTIVRAHSRQTEVNIATCLEADLPVICGNPFQLEQVVTNLLLNALQSLPPQGSRRVFLTTMWHQHDNSVSLEVRDEGHGIPAGHLPHLCEPFFSTRINKGGSGLGLYIANFIVNDHQGRLEFSSKPGAGTSVTIHLPVTRTGQADNPLLSVPAFSQ
jgi:signal transduction histidine kinase